ncbi:hypothetical protein TBR22_A28800 [Luteitalea sp. TBR-22]|uniref:SRPBCC family protein n=1 Tax=Luteitalea sp. TBR-22 TaxID=2802971 RepID=UPI001EF57C30|nr:SRPBCC family protein [Luteitalea sp. TBR-22]BCS33653.2 hypothetical protein TBR22_A28800 [Luteitalea sp. TBR-22]
MRTNLGTWERIGSVAAGAGLLYVAARRPAWRRTSQAVGAGLVMRGMSGACPVKQAMVGDGRRTDTRRALGGPAGIHVREKVVIRRPAHEVYAFWRDFENLARFLRHVERVDVLDGSRSHWVVKGPGDMRFQWDAEILSDEPDALISWKSIGEADVVSAGSVIFKPMGGTHTQVAVHFQYAPPGGRAARAIAALFGHDPAAQVREDLDRLRSLLEGREDVRPEVVAAVTPEPLPDPGHQPW